MAAVAGLVVLLRAVPARADDSDDDSGLRELYLGRCTMGSGTRHRDIEDSGVTTCVKGAAGAELMSVAGHGKESTWLRYANGYAGVHVNTLVSFHGRAEARAVETLRENDSRDTEPLLPHPRRALIPDYALMRIGNPVLHRYRAAVGRMRLPFGIDGAVAPETVREQETRAFWASPPYAISAVTDNLSTTSMEIGFATDAYARKRDPRGGRAGLTAASFRWTYDMSALDGSRLVFSGYEEETGIRRGGAAFVTQSRQGDLWHAELVRILASPDGLAADFLQLIRIGYRSAQRTAGRYTFQLDDERFRFRQGTMAYEANLIDHVIGRLALSYSKDESGGKENRWYVMSALEVRL